MLQSTGLSSTECGGKWNQRQSIRFQSPYSSPFAGLKGPYWIIQNPPDEPTKIYALGTGGRYKYELCADAAGQPGDVLAAGMSFADDQYPQPSDKRGIFTQLCFEPAPSLIAGAWYHIVISNVDPNPAANFRSLDFLAGDSDQPPTIQILLSAEGGPFGQVDYLIGSPLQFNFSNGLSWGVPYIDVVDGVPESGAQYGFFANLKPPV